MTQAHRDTACAIRCGTSTNTEGSRYDWRVRQTAGCGLGEARRRQERQPGMHTCRHYVFANGCSGQWVTQGRLTETRDRMQT